MNLSISGSPGSGHLTVARMLADRLDLKIFSAANTANRLYRNNPYTMTEFKKHLNIDLDKQVNDALLQEVIGQENYICDAIVAHKIVTDSVSIFLDVEFVSNSVFTTQKFIGYNNDLLLSEKFLDHRFDDARYYDIYLNRTGLSDEECVEFLIECMVTALYGTYIPTWLCIPAYPLSTDTSTGYYRQDQFFDVFKSGPLYFLRGDYRDAFTHVIDKHLLRCYSDTLYESGVTPIPTVLSNFKWYKVFIQYAMIPILNNMLALYCKDIGEDDYREVFETLAQNGDAFRTLRSMGYDK